jgi:N-acetyl-gamma-glutamyl-phosphate reductase
MKVAVVGASGYTGLELLRILLRHPQFEIAAITSEQRAGQALGVAFPALRGQFDLAFEVADPSVLAGRVELAFTALPHSASAPSVRELRAAGVAVADLSADFRLRDLETYRSWYGAHAAPELVASAVYGLPELYRESLRGAQLVAVPGCYPTSVLLPLVPLLRAGLVQPTGLHVDAKSGVSGAGRKLEAEYLFAELDANCRAYKPGYAHRHAPEIEQEASAAAGTQARVTFVPHLLPAVRGIVASVYARPAGRCTADDARAALKQAYRGGGGGRRRAQRHPGAALGAGQSRQGRQRSGRAVRQPDVRPARGDRSSGSAARALSTGRWTRARLCPRRKDLSESADSPWDCTRSARASARRHPSLTPVHFQRFDATCSPRYISKNQLGSRWHPGKFVPPCGGAQMCSDPPR